MIYIVNPGDTLYTIAGQFGITPRQILYDNQIPPTQTLVAGQALLLRLPGEEQLPVSLQEITGYAYPFIDFGILQESITTLTGLFVFSYGFTAKGELVPPKVNDLPPVEAAWENGVRPILVLTPFGADGMFNNYLVSVITGNPEVQNRLIQNLLLTVRERGYAGVDVDFEYILAEDKEAYAAFVGNLRAALAPYGFTVSAALAPKTSADQPGLLYEGMDYRLLGEKADSVFLMTYEWGFTYGPPMAVAPLNKVREVVDFAVSQISRDKIIMGIPNYAYDWTLPFVKGTSKAALISNVRAVQLAAENNAAIQFDETAASPYFHYWKDGVQHEVWFEDVRSIERKLRLADAYGLLGVGYWNLMRPFRANWLLIKELNLG